MSTSAQPPVTPRPSALPIGDLGWERFEQFAHDLLNALPGVRPETAHRYGTQGQTQRGIDLIAERDGGEWWAFSNKRYKSYQPHHVGKHVTETTYRADRYFILISGTASADVRDEVRKYPCWELWDAEDLSSMVRRLAPDQARRLVDHHFGPTWRRDFLGLPAVGAFVPPADYFRIFLEAGRLFDHATPLVGREALAGEMAGFAESGPQRVLVLPGRGGIGKTRLLRHLAEAHDAAHPERAVRLLNDGVPVTQEALDELPHAPTLVVVDDAHRRTDLPLLLAWLRVRPDCRLVLAARPRGVDCLLDELTRAGFDATHVRRAAPVERLSRVESQELARRVLGEGLEGLAVRLAQATRDCPLVTVVGGRLLAQRAIAPELLERDASFRQEVLGRFREELLGRVSDSVPQDFARRLLEAVAALHPVPPGPGPTHDGLAAFLGASAADVTRALGEFERVGLLARRGGLVRIAPDVLADHVLHSACVTPQGESTGFADRLFDAFARGHLARLLRNLAELDWRVRTASDADPELLDRVWGKVRGEFEAAGHGGRAEILGLIGESANFLPEKVLGLVEFALGNPSSPSAEEVIPGWLSYSHGTVLRAIPGLLRRCSVSEACLPRCLDLLWDLAGGDDRPPNANPDHPFRTITEIAEYASRKPLWVNRAVLEAARGWLRRPDAFSRPHSPLDALDPLLALSGIEHESEGNGIRFQASLWGYESVRKLREEVLSTVEGCLTAGDTRTVLRAVKSLRTALDGPVAFLNMVVPDEAFTARLGEQLRVLHLFGRVVGGGHPPVVLLAVVNELRPSALYSRSPEVRDVARSLIRSVDQSFDFRVTRMLLPRMSRWDSFDEEQFDGEATPEEHDARYQRLARAVAADFWLRFPSPADAVAELGRLLGELLSVEPQAEADGVVWFLLEARPADALSVARELTLAAGSAAAGCLHVALSRVRLSSPGDAVAACLEALDTGVVGHRRSVARFCEWGTLAGAELHAGEPALFQRLIGDPDPAVRRAGIAALRRLARSRPREAIDAAVAAEVGSDAKSVVELCRLADARWGGVPEALTDADVAALLGKMDALVRVEHDSAALLTVAWTRVPHAALAMFLRRIGRQNEAGYSSGFQAVPFESGGRLFEGLAGSPHHADILRRVRDSSLGQAGGCRLSLADLYRHVSLGYDATGVEVLAEWVRAGDANQLEAAVSLLRHAHRNFVFNGLDLVGVFLERAATFGGECQSTVTRQLHVIAVGSSRHGVSGQPFPQDVEVRDRTTAALPDYTPGSVMHRFLTAVLREVEVNIRTSVRDDDD